MKNAIILHGGNSSPDHYWFLSIKKFLVSNGFDVWLPQLPDSDNPSLNSWLPFVLKKGIFQKDTLLICHSLGSALALSILEKINISIACTVLVAGFCLPRGNFKEPVLQKEFDWKKIKAACREFIFINSQNDPWGCDDKQGMELWNHLGGTLILSKTEGHFGSEKFGQTYTHFPLLEKLLEIKINN